MTTAAAPVVETGGSPSPVDPIDALDLSSIDDGVEMTSDAELPESMVIGVKKREAAEPESEASASGEQQRGPDGKFAKTADEQATDGQQAAQPSPFRYRSMGKTHDLDGATLDATGNLTIPAAKVGDVQQAFNALEMAKGSYMPAIESRNQRIAQLTREIEEAKQGSTVEAAQAKSLMDALIPMLEEPDDERALASLFELRRNFPILRERARAAHFEAMAKRGAPAAPAAHATPNNTQQPSMPSAAEARAHATEAIEQWKTQPNFRDIPADAWKQVEAKLAKTPYAYMRQATADDAKAHPGLIEGQIVLDTDLLFADVTSHREQQSAARETAAAQAKLAADNARRTQSSVNAPPTPGGGRAPTPKSKTPQTREEMDAWFDSDSLD